MANQTDIRVDLAAGLNELDLENIQNTLPYLSAQIESFRIDARECRLHVVIREGADPAALRARIEAHLEKIRPIASEAPMTVTFDNLAATPPCRDDVLPLLLARRDLVPHGPGIYSLHGKLQKMYKSFDAAALRFAQKQGAQEALYPVTISIETLRKVNFFSTYPHFANFISTLEEDAEKISAAARRDPASQRFAPLLQEPAAICRSAGCLHSYPTLENEVFQPGRRECITMSGRIFRNESVNVRGLERLNEYGMREIIYFGTPEYVQERLRECLDWLAGLMSEHGLQGLIQTANDPFFADNLATLQNFQRSQQTKFEARLVNPFNGNRISVGSVNYHGAHFSKSFNIRFSDGDFVSSGCVGFGLERTIFLVLAQFGYDESRWPESLRTLFLS